MLRLLNMAALPSYCLKSDKYSNIDQSIFRYVTLLIMKHIVTQSFSPLAVFEKVLSISR